MENVRAFGSVIILMLWLLSACVTHGHPQFRSDPLESGDSCTLIDGSSGVCIRDRECPYAIDLFKSKKFDKIVRCGFEGRSQVVCCRMTTIPKTIRNPSAKFTKALCKGNVEKIPMKPYRLEYHIIRGEQAEVAEFPFMAALGYESNSGVFDFRCGGTLIADDFVMTAAHCANRKGLGPKIVRLGKTSLKDGRDFEEAQDIKIKEIILGDYKSLTRENDIALLRLEAPAKMTHNVFPACLAGGDKSHVDNLTVIGFGRISNDDDTTSDWLLKATTGEVHLEECTNNLRSVLQNRALTEKQLCAFDSKIKSDACQGDSGGPLFYYQNNLSFVYGITSYGIGCGSNLPSIYTRVDKYLDWIKDKLESQ